MTNLKISAVEIESGREHIMQLKKPGDIIYLIFDGTNPTITDLTTGKTAAVRITVLEV